MGIWQRLTAPLRRAPAASAKLARSGQVVPDQAIWSQFQRIGGSLTPSQVSEIIRCADTGDMRLLVDLANEMRQKDGHLQSVLQTRETALSSLSWEIVFPGQSTKQRPGARAPRGTKQRKFVEAALRANPHLRRLIAHLTGAVFYGYSVAETIWKVDSRGQMVPDRFVCHNARRFGFRSSDGHFVWRDDGMTYEGVDFVAQYPDKFITSHPRVNGDVPCREGLVRVLMWLALFRNWAWSDWLKLAEIAWKPWRLAKYDKKSGTDDIADAEAILAGMTSSGYAVYPNTVEIELRWPDGGVAGKGVGGPHESLLAVAGAEMSKAVLGQTLTTEQGSTGSQALGKVHNEVRKDILWSDAEHIADVITHWLIEPMIRLNFGPSAPVPRFQFVTEDATDMVAFATALDKLAPILEMPAEWARDRLGIPHPEEDDELVGVRIAVEEEDGEDVDTSELDDDEESEAEAEAEEEAAKALVATQREAHAT